MHKQEIKIVTKIIREISFFFILQGHMHFVIDTHINDNNSLIVVTLTKPKQKMLDFIVEHLKEERELSTETYGWELIGEIDSESEFELLGTMIDDVLIKTDGDHTELTFIRNSRYNK
ncbi:MAG: hypothetical protein ACOCU1_01355 [Bacillota bacterium]